MKEITYTPIAFFQCENSKPYGAPRQAVLAKNSTGVIVFDPSMSKDSIADLEGFDRIWLIYDFHHNNTWKPKVRPPRSSNIKRGVFSTRSPYRPNSIGMSCVKLLKVEGLKIYVSEHDLLNDTPILDIKPYLPYADSFDNAKTGWVREEEKFAVKYSDKASERLSWLSENLDLDVMGIAESHLEYSPTCGKAKRVKKQEQGYVFSFQAWRLPFSIVGDSVLINDLYSGYSQDELNDKKTPKSESDLHKRFCEAFSKQEDSWSE